MGIDVKKWLESLKERRGKHRGGMEVCEYCDQAYHPMPRWEKGGKIIFVCDHRVRGNGSLQPSDCPTRAKADGYTRRPDLTPSR